MRRDFSRPVNSANPPQRLAQNFLFEFQLRLVGNMLVVAAATNTEVRALWRDARSRRRHYLIEPGANEFFLLFHRRDARNFPRQHEWNKYGRPPVMRQPFAAVNQFFNRYVNHEQVGSASGPTERPKTPMCGR